MSQRRAKAAPVNPLAALARECAAQIDTQAKLDQVLASVEDAGQRAQLADRLAPWLKFCPACA